IHSSFLAGGFIIDQIGLLSSYKLLLSFDFVERKLGGIIPADVQGMYRSGIPAMSTAMNSPYYHTKADTPEKVDVVFLAKAMNRLDNALKEIILAPPSKFVQHDPNLWKAHLVVGKPAADQSIGVDVRLADSADKTLAGKTVTATFFCNDFYAQPDVTSTTDGA